MDNNIPFRSKEESWLAFNARVLQEARDPKVPLQERLLYLGIYSNNLDEFFRVRVATLKRLSQISAKYQRLGIPDPSLTLDRVLKVVAKQSKDFDQGYKEVLEALEENGVKVVTADEVPKSLRDYLLTYFHAKVKPHLMPVMIKGYTELDDLRDEVLYLAVRLSHKNGSGRRLHALVEIPESLPRFMVLPERKSKQKRLVMYLDDIIRFGFSDLFESLPYDTFEGYAVKFTRDAEMLMDDDFTESTYEKIAEALVARSTGSPVRINHDVDVPKTFLQLLQKKLRLKEVSTLFPGARYHNRRDLMKFPALGDKTWRFPPAKPIPHRHVESGQIFKSLRARDILFHFPYHSFDNFLDLMREAVLDPLVATIKLTHYRIAADSCVAAALISAVKNGKKVVVCVEPQARFDEKANIQWADRFRRAGIRVILGVTGLKVHAKICLIQRNEKGSLRNYACVGTGNFNESTSTLYTDHMLMTSDKRIADEVKSVFSYLERSYRPPKLKHLVIAPFDLRTRVRAIIEREIENARAGGKASLKIKINNISDMRTVDLLYQASRAGVQIQIIARSMFSVITGTEYSKNIRAIGIVDRYLEHTRFLVAHNGGKPEYYISSADFLPRNFDSRIEVLCPIYDSNLQEELDTYFRLQWNDGEKARVLDMDLTNKNRKKARGKSAQRSIPHYLRKKNKR